MDNRPIGIFDSGLGGLTCVREVMRIMPGEDIIYFGDTGRVPYGTRSSATIVKYVRQDINFLRSFDIKFIIIACGTASSAALPHITTEYDTDIIGVVDPASKRAVNATKNGRIGVLGTSGTIKSGKYKKTIGNLNPEIEVISNACPMFVPVVENGYSDTEIARILAEEYLEVMVKNRVDTIILGCTHYPLLKNTIRSIVGSGVTLIDSGAAAAEEAFRIIKKDGLLNARKDGGHAKYYVSDTVHGFEELGSLFLSKKIVGDVAKIDIEKY
ncbi:MAG TPA: glutamate racemase [Candidatus Monoglobus merdigallinarum]|uniref:Glutamate racemase n=1 Tax=Candidatus Monoglobus merdigallinarum TaxID=2838698 RepID=A0A9D1PRP2_9FIRM|nr:glutamate racemase [Candidatus Monoglobus merdigallinarum]